ncbi:hypothetical protein KFU94_01785 [Chloroflexi bacterium TSY]|nr:hypothetical protein [Chloroflexi bacterium TSY]
MQGIRVIVFVAVLWLFSGWLMGLAVRAVFQLDWVWPCMSLNLLFGMLLLRWVTRTEREQEILFEGAERGDEESSLAAWLVAIPLTLILLAVIWLLMAPFLNYYFND